MNRSRHLSLGFDRFSGLYLWALFIIVFSIWNPSLFPTSTTAHVVAAGQAVTGVLAIAVLLPLVTGTYDLSVGSVANFATILVISLQTSHGVNPLVATLAVLVISVLIGAVNGLLVVKLRVSSFIATLGMATVIAAFQTITAGNSQPLPATSAIFLHFTSTTVFGFPIVFLYLIVIAFIAWWVLDLTPAGRYMYAIGGNADAARLSGVKTGKWVWLSLMASAGLSGLAGVFFASFSGPSLTYGTSALLPAFAAVFLGSTQLRPGRFNIWGTILAIFVLATGVEGLSYVTGVQWLNDMFNGVALLVAVSFAVSRRGNRKKVEADDASVPDQTSVSRTSGELPIPLEK
jgi:ribose transport system permease protein